MPRSSHTEALLGPEVYRKVRETPVLVVGAGGIGCELLKNLVMVGFANIEIIDLDTIDLSNLNRQFLFRKPDISKPKALVAAATARHFNPSSGINIHARHGNVKEGQNDLEWIKGFGLVMNALDNMDARRHVNRLCQAGGVALIESGTAGYLGQVTPIISGRTECFDCVPKQAPKSFPVCTIRATPSEPIHCIVWAKSYLFGKLFGEDDESVDEDELNKAQAEGENAEEIENLKKEAAAFREVRNSLGEEDGPRRVFEKVFNADINRLLSMEDMWKVSGRVKPKALDYESITDGSFVPPPLRTAATAAPAANANGTSNGSTSTNGAPNEINGTANGSAASTSNGHSTAPIASAVSSRQLKDQRELSLKENLELFVDSCRRLSARAIAHPNTLISFDKDDPDTLDFVLSTANLRATAYGIPTKTRFQVKEMAGNIIPAIATTNAIIAGMIVMQAIQILGKKFDKLRNTFTKLTAGKPIGFSYPSGPSRDCVICQDSYVPLRVDVGKCTLGEFVLDIVKGWLASRQGIMQEHGAGEEEGEEEELEWSVFEGGRLLADPDFDDNYGRTLLDLGIERGKIMTVEDEDLKYRQIHFCLCELDDGVEGSEGKSYSLPSNKPAFILRPQKLQVQEEGDDEIEHVETMPTTEVTTNGTAIAGTKRPAPDDDDDVPNGDGAAAKKQKVEAIDATAVDDDDDDFEIL